MALPITATYAGVLALWVIFLLMAVVRFRRSAQVALGDGGDSHGERMIRGHANATETVPLFLILLGLAEGLGSPVWLLHGLGLAFLAGRVMHGVHFLRERRGLVLRFCGMLLTLAAMLAAAIDLLRHAVF